MSDLYFERIGTSPSLMIDCPAISYDSLDYNLAFHSSMKMTCFRGGFCEHNSYKICLFIERRNDRISNLLLRHFTKDFRFLHL